MIRKGNEWYATSPTHLLGWDITVEGPDDGNGYILVRAVKRDTKEVRYVRATEEAVPLLTLERNNRK